MRLAGSELPQPTRVANTTDPEICGRIQTLEDILVSSQNRGIRNVIVVLKNVPAAKIPARPPGRLTLDNRECKFVPHVSVLTVGSAIQAVNRDPTLHNAHFYGAINANLALAFKGVKRTTKVEQPGMVIVKCDVHGWMQAFIRVESHPFQAVTDENGSFRIPDIPAGAYDLEIWHEKLGALEKTVSIESTKTEIIHVEYALNNRSSLLQGGLKYCFASLAMTFDFLDRPASPKRLFS
ncbi:MAG: hypothetical protein ACE5IR_19495 [bacterium]